MAHTIVGQSDVYIPYTSPSLLRMGLALRGLACAGGEAEPRILELGGGLIPVLHAATLPGEFWLADGDPARTLRAAERARAAGLRLHTLNAGLAELAADKNLPSFHMILVHEVWSFVGNEGRRRIVELLDRRLVPGGVACIDYAALPGWYAASGPRDLAALFLGRGRGAPLAQLKRLAGLPGFFARHPEAAGLARSLSAPPACFLPDWQPFHFAEMVEALGRARLSWGGPACSLDALDAVNIPPDALALLEEQDDPVLRETLRDYILNRSQRRDVFVKGLRRLNPRERMAAVGGLRVALTCPPEAVPSSFESPLGACALKDELYTPVLAALADRDYAPKTVEELEDHPLLAAMDSATLEEALVVLSGLGTVHPAPDADGAEAAHARCDALNALLERDARAGEGGGWLTSPRLGCAVSVSTLEQLFLISLREGGATPDAWGEDAWAVLAGQGRRLSRDGVELDDEQAEAEIRALAANFAERRLPFLRAAGVATEKA